MTRARKSGARGVPAKPQVLQECRLKVLGGLQSDLFNNLVANQALNSLWTGNAARIRKPGIYRQTLHSRLRTHYGGNA